MVVSAVNRSAETTDGKKISPVGIFFLLTTRTNHAWIEATTAPPLMDSSAMRASRRDRAATAQPPRESAGPKTPNRVRHASRSTHGGSDS